MKNRLKNLWSLLWLYAYAPQVAKLIRQVRNDKLTYLDISALADIHKTVAQLEKEEKKGDLLEAGVALGGSSLILATSKQKQRSLYLFDAFETIPPPSERDGEDAHDRYKTIISGQAEGIKGEAYYGYRQDLLTTVIDNFRRYGIDPDENNITPIKGYYENTLVVNSPVALAHIDSDWYDSVMICLQVITPHLVSGGVLIIDDYNDWSGCRKAVDDYFSDSKDDFIFVMKSRLHITKK